MWQFWPIKTTGLLHVGGQENETVRWNTISYVQTGFHKACFNGWFRQIFCDQSIHCPTTYAFWNLIWCDSYPCRTWRTRNWKRNESFQKTGPVELVWRHTEVVCAYLMSCSASRVPTRMSLDVITLLTAPSAGTIRLLWCANMAENLSENHIHHSIPRVNAHMHQDGQHPKNTCTAETDWSCLILYLREGMH